MKGMTASFCAVLAAAAAGCATQGYERAANTAAQVRAVRTSVEAFQKQVDVTTASMSALLGGAHDGLREKFEAFSREVDALASSGGSYKSSVQSMRRAAMDRFQSWEAESQQITNAEMRAKSSERRSEVMDTYRAAEAAAEEMASQIGPFVLDIQDLRKVLSIDLTPAGIDAASDLSGRIKEGSRKVAKAAKPVLETVDRAADALAAGQEAGQPGAAPPKETPKEEPKK
jgi:DUF2959 family protein